MFNIFSKVFMFAIFVLYLTGCEKSSIYINYGKNVYSVRCENKLDYDKVLRRICSNKFMTYKCPITEEELNKEIDKICKNKENYKDLFK